MTASFRLSRLLVGSSSSKHTTIPGEYQESPTAKGVSIFFQKGIDKRKETQYYGWQLAGANQILTLWLAMSNHRQNSESGD